MSSNAFKVATDSWPEHNRYRLLLEITDLVARANNLPDAFQQLAPPVLALTGGGIVESFPLRPAP